AHYFGALHASRSYAERAAVRRECFNAFCREGRRLRSARESVHLRTEGHVWRQEHLGGRRNLRLRFGKRGWHDYPPLPCNFQDENMKTSGAGPGQSASALISKKIAELGDWRGKALGRMRKLVKEADPDV